MSVAKSVKKRVLATPRGRPFTNTRYLSLGSRSAVDKALSRLVESGVIRRIAPGVFVRPKESPYVGQVMPEVGRVVEAIAKGNGETVQVHGAEAARQFRLTTQAPTQPTYYTNGTSREVRVGNLPIRFVHTSNRHKLQHAGKKPGVALSALWYLGKENVNADVIEEVRAGLSPAEFETLQHAHMPGWMANAFTQYRQHATHA